jgi:uncharacterized protein YegP (UPF0339 family)
MSPGLHDSLAPGRPGEHDARELARPFGEPNWEVAMAAKFEVYKSGAQFRWRLKAGNGEIVATGEAYKTRSGAMDGVEAVKRAAAAAVTEDLTDNA